MLKRSSRSQRLLVLFTFIVVCSAASRAGAATIPLTIETPDFLIPLGSQTGTLTVYSDGTAPETTGFDSLGTQTFMLAGNSSSTGTLTVNLWFLGFPLGDPAFAVTDAQLQFTLHDLDFIPDQITGSVTLREYALIKSVNDSRLYSPINLANYLPAGTPTDDKTVILNPIDLMPPLVAADFTDPFIISLRLDAVVKNTGSQAVYLTNTPEALISDTTLTVTAVHVPEPSILLLLGSASLFGRWKRYGRSAAA